MDDRQISNTDKSWDNKQSATDLDEILVQQGMFKASRVEGSRGTMNVFCMCTSEKKEFDSGCRDGDYGVDEQTSRTLSQYDETDAEKGNVEHHGSMSRIGITSVDGGDVDGGGVDGRCVNDVFGTHCAGRVATIGRMYDVDVTQLCDEDIMIGSFEGGNVEDTQLGVTYRRESPCSADTLPSPDRSGSYNENYHYMKDDSLNTGTYSSDETDSIPNTDCHREMITSVNKPKSVPSSPECYTPHGRYDSITSTGLSPMISSKCAKRPSNITLKTQFTYIQCEWDKISSEIDGSRRIAIIAEILAMIDKHLPDRLFIWEESQDEHYVVRESTDVDEDGHPSEQNCIHDVQVTQSKAASTDLPDSKSGSRCRLKEKEEDVSSEGDGSSDNDESNDGDGSPKDDGPPDNDGSNDGDGSPEGNGAPESDGSPSGGGSSEGHGSSEGNGAPEENDGTNEENDGPPESDGSPDHECTQDEFGNGSSLSGTTSHETEVHDKKEHDGSPSRGSDENYAVDVHVTGSKPSMTVSSELMAHKMKQFDGPPVQECDKDELDTGCMLSVGPSYEDRIHNRKNNDGSDRDCTVDHVITDEALPVSLSSSTEVKVREGKFAENPSVLSVSDEHLTESRLSTISSEDVSVETKRADVETPASHEHLTSSTFSDTSIDRSVIISSDMSVDSKEECETPDSHDTLSDTRSLVQSLTASSDMSVDREEYETQDNHGCDGPTSETNAFEPSQTALDDMVIVNKDSVVPLSSEALAGRASSDTIGVDPNLTASSDMIIDTTDSETPVSHETVIGGVISDTGLSNRSDVDVDSSEGGARLYDSVNSVSSDQEECSSTEKGLTVSTVRSTDSKKDLCGRVDVLVCDCDQQLSNTGPSADGTVVHCVTGSDDVVADGASHGEGHGDRHGDESVSRIDDGELSGSVLDEVVVAVPNLPVSCDSNCDSAVDSGESLTDATSETVDRDLTDSSDITVQCGQDGGVPLTDAMSETLVEENLTACCDVTVHSGKGGEISCNEPLADETSSETVTVKPDKFGIVSEMPITPVEVTSEVRKESDVTSVMPGTSGDITSENTDTPVSVTSAMPDNCNVTSEVPDNCNVTSKMPDTPANITSEMSEDSNVISVLPNDSNFTSEMPDPPANVISDMPDACADVDTSKMPEDSNVTSEMPDTPANVTSEMHDMSADVKPEIRKESDATSKKPDPNGDPENPQESYFPSEMPDTPVVSSEMPDTPVVSFEMPDTPVVSSEMPQTPINFTFEMPDTHAEVLSEMSDDSNVTSEMPDPPADVTPEASDPPVNTTSKMPVTPASVTSEMPDDSNGTSKMSDVPADDTSEMPDYSNVTSEMADPPSDVTSEMHDDSKVTSGISDDSNVTSEILDSPANVTSEITDTSDDVTSEMLETAASVTSEMPVTPANVTSEMPDSPAGVTSEMPETMAGAPYEMPDIPANVTSEMSDTPDNVTSEMPGTSANVTSEMFDSPDNVTSEMPDSPDNVTSEMPGTSVNVTSEMPDSSANVTSETPDIPADVTSEMPGTSVNVTYEMPDSPANVTSETSDIPVDVTSEIPDSPANVTSETPDIPVDVTSEIPVTSDIPVDVTSEMPDTSANVTSEMTDDSNVTPEMPETSADARSEMPETSADVTSEMSGSPADVKSEIPVTTEMPETTAGVTSEMSVTCANVTSGTSDIPADVTSEMPDSPANVTSEISDTCASVTSEMPCTSVNVTYEMPDSPANVTSETSDIPADVTSEMPDSPAGVTSEIPVTSDIPVDVTSEMSDTLANVTSEMTDDSIVTPEMPETSADARSEMPETSVDVTSEIHDIPANVTFEMPDSPAHVTSEIPVTSDIPVDVTSEMPDIPANVTSEMSGSPVNVTPEMPETTACVTSEISDTCASVTSEMPCTSVNVTYEMPDSPANVTSETSDIPADVTSEMPDSPADVTSEIPVTSDIPVDVTSEIPDTLANVTSEMTDDSIVTPEMPETSADARSEMPETSVDVTSEIHDIPANVTFEMPDSPAHVTSEIPVTSDIPVDVTSEMPDIPANVTSEMSGSPVNVTPEMPETTACVTSEISDTCASVTSEMPGTSVNVTYEMPDSPANVTSETSDIPADVTSEMPDSPADVTSEMPVTSDIPVDVTSEIPDSPANVTSKMPDIPADVTSEMPDSPADVTSEIPVTSDIPADVTSEMPDSPADVTSEIPITSEIPVDVTSEMPGLPANVTPEMPETTACVTSEISDTCASVTSEMHGTSVNVTYEMPDSPANVTSETSDIPADVTSEMPDSPADVTSEMPVTSDIPVDVASEIPDSPANVTSKMPDIPADVTSEMSGSPADVTSEIPVTSDIPADVTSEMPDSPAHVTSEIPIPSDIPVDVTSEMPGLPANVTSETPDIPVDVTSEMPITSDIPVDVTSEMPDTSANVTSEMTDDSNVTPEMPETSADARSEMPETSANVTSEMSGSPADVKSEKPVTTEMPETTAGVTSEMSVTCASVTSEMPGTSVNVTYETPDSPANVTPEMSDIPADVTSEVPDSPADVTSEIPVTSDIPADVTSEMPDSPADVTSEIPITSEIPVDVTSEMPGLPANVTPEMPETTACVTSEISDTCASVTSEMHGTSVNVTYEMPDSPANVTSETSDIPADVTSEMPDSPADVTSEMPVTSDIPVDVASEIPDSPTNVTSKMPDIPADVTSEMSGSPADVTSEIPVTSDIPADVTSEMPDSPAHVTSEIPIPSDIPVDVTSEMPGLPANVTSETPDIPVDVTSEMPITSDIPVDVTSEMPDTSANVTSEMTDDSNVTPEMPETSADARSEMPETSANVTSEMSGSPADVKSEKPVTTEMPETTAGVTSEMSVTCASVTSEMPGTSVNVTYETPDSPANVTPEMSDIPADVTSEVPDISANVTSEITDDSNVTSEMPYTLVIVTSETFNPSSLVTSETPNPPDNLTSERPDTSADVTCELSDTSADVTSQIPDPPASVTSEMPDPPVNVSTKLSDTPANITSERLDSPVDPINPEEPNTPSEVPDLSVGVTFEMPDAPGITSSQMNVNFQEENGDCSDVHLSSNRKPQSGEELCVNSSLNVCNDDKITQTNDGQLPSNKLNNTTAEDLNLNTQLHASSNDQNTQTVDGLLVGNRMSDTNEEYLDVSTPLNESSDEKTTQTGDDQLPSNRQTNTTEDLDATTPLDESSDEKTTQTGDGQLPSNTQTNTTEDLDTTTSLNERSDEKTTQTGDDLLPSNTQTNTTEDLDIANSSELIVCSDDKTTQTSDDQLPGNKKPDINGDLHVTTPLNESSDDKTTQTGDEHLPSNRQTNITEYHDVITILNESRDDKTTKTGDEHLPSNRQSKTTEDFVVTTPLNVSSDDRTTQTSDEYLLINKQTDTTENLAVTIPLNVSNDDKTTQTGDDQLHGNKQDTTTENHAVTTPCELTVCTDNKTTQTGDDKLPDNRQCESNVEDSTMPLNMNSDEKTTQTGVEDVNLTTESELNVSDGEKTTPNDYLQSQPETQSKSIGIDTMDLEKQMEELDEETSMADPSGTISVKLDVSKKDAETSTADPGGTISGELDVSKKDKEASTADPSGTISRELHEYQKGEAFDNAEQQSGVIEDTDGTASGELDENCVIEENIGTGIHTVMISNRTATREADESIFKKGGRLELLPYNGQPVTASGDSGLADFSDTTMDSQLSDLSSLTPLTSPEETKAVVCEDTESIQPPTTRGKILHTQAYDTLPDTDPEEKSTLRASDTHHAETQTEEQDHFTARINLSENIDSQRNDIVNNVHSQAREMLCNDGDTVSGVRTDKEISDHKEHQEPYSLTSEDGENLMASLPSNPNRYEGHGNAEKTDHPDIRNRACGRVASPVLNQHLSVGRQTDIDNLCPSHMQEDKDDLGRGHHTTQDSYQRHTLVGGEHNPTLSNRHSSSKGLSNESGPVEPDPADCISGNTSGADSDEETLRRDVIDLSPSLNQGCLDRLVEGPPDTNKLGNIFAVNLPLVDTERVDQNIDSRSPSLHQGSMNDFEGHDSMMKHSSELESSTEGLISKASFIERVSDGRGTSSQCAAYGDIVLEEQSERDHRSDTHTEVAGYDCTKIQCVECTKCDVTMGISVSIQCPDDLDDFSTCSPSSNQHHSLDTPHREVSSPETEVIDNREVSPPETEVTENREVSPPETEAIENKENSPSETKDIEEHGISHIQSKCIENQEMSPPQREGMEKDEISPPDYSEHLDISQAECTEKEKMLNAKHPGQSPQERPSPENIPFEHSSARGSGQLRTRAICIQDPHCSSDYIGISSVMDEEDDEHSNSDGVRRKPPSLTATLSRDEPLMSNVSGPDSDCQHLNLDISPVMEEHEEQVDHSCKRLSKDDAASRSSSASGCSPLKNDEHFLKNISDPESDHQHIYDVSSGCSSLDVKYFKDCLSENCNRTVETVNPCRHADQSDGKYDISRREKQLRVPRNHEQFHNPGITLTSEANVGLRHDQVPHNHGMSSDIESSAIHTEDNDCNVSEAASCGGRPALFNPHADTCPRLEPKDPLDINRYGNTEFEEHPLNMMELQHSSQVRLIPAPRSAFSPVGKQRTKNRHSSGSSISVSSYEQHNHRNRHSSGPCTSLYPVLHNVSPSKDSERPYFEQTLLRGQQFSGTNLDENDIRSNFDPSFHRHHQHLDSGISSLSGSPIDVRKGDRQQFSEPVDSVGNLERHYRRPHSTESQCFGGGARSHHNDMGEMQDEVDSSTGSQYDRNFEFGRLEQTNQHCSDSSPRVSRRNASMTAPYDLKQNDSRADDNPRSASTNLSSASQECVPSVSQYDVPHASQQNVLSASQQNVPSASQQNVPSASQQNVPITSPHNVPSGSQENVPSASHQTAQCDRRTVDNPQKNDHYRTDSEGTLLHPEDDADPSKGVKKNSYECNRNRFIYIGDVGSIPENQLRQTEKSIDSIINHVDSGVHHTESSRHSVDSETERDTKGFTPPLFQGNVVAKHTLDESTDEPQRSSWYNPPTLTEELIGEPQINHHNNQPVDVLNQARIPHEDCRDRNDPVIQSYHEEPSGHQPHLEICTSDKSGTTVSIRRDEQSGGTSQMKERSVPKHKQQPVLQDGFDVPCLNDDSNMRGYEQLQPQLANQVPSLSGQYAEKCMSLNTGILGIVSGVEDCLDDGNHCPTDNKKYCRDKKQCDGPSGVQIAQDRPSIALDGYGRVNQHDSTCQGDLNEQLGQWDGEKTCPMNINGFPDGSRDTEAFPGGSKDIEGFSGGSRETEHFSGGSRDTEEFLSGSREAEGCPSGSKDTAGFPGGSRDIERFPSSNEEQNKSSQVSKEKDGISSIDQCDDMIERQTVEVNDQSEADGLVSLGQLDQVPNITVEKTCQPCAESDGFSIVSHQSNELDQCGNSEQKQRVLNVVVEGETDAAFIAPDHVIASPKPRRRRRTCSGNGNSSIDRYEYEDVKSSREKLNGIFFLPIESPRNSMLNIPENSANSACSSSELASEKKSVVGNSLDDLSLSQQQLCETQDHAQSAGHNESDWHANRCLPEESSTQSEQGHTAEAEEGPDHDTEEEGVSVTGGCGEEEGQEHSGQRQSGQRDSGQASDQEDSGQDSSAEMDRRMQRRRSSVDILSNDGSIEDGRGQLVLANRAAGYNQLPLRRRGSLPRVKQLINGDSNYLSSYTHLQGAGNQFSVRAEVHDSQLAHYYGQQEGQFTRLPHHQRGNAFHKQFPRRPFSRTEYDSPMSPPNGFIDEHDSLYPMRDSNAMQGAYDMDYHTSREYNSPIKASRRGIKSYDGPVSVQDPVDSMSSQDGGGHTEAKTASSSNQHSSSANQHQASSHASSNHSHAAAANESQAQSQVNGTVVEDRKNLRNLPIEEVIEKCKSIVEELGKLEEYHRGEGMRLQKMLGDFYWDYTLQRREIGDAIAEAGYAEITIKMLKSLNTIGIFKNDDVWFPAYYTYNTTWNYSDTSDTLAKNLAEADAVRLLSLNCSHKPYITNIHSKNVFYVMKASMSILHNIARNPNVKGFFKENKTAEVIMPFINMNDDMLRVLAMLTLAYIVEEEDNSKLIDETGTIKNVVMWIGKALDNPKRRFKGFTPQELTQGLDKLAVNDGNKLKITEEGSIPLFMKMLLSDNDKEQSTTARCIWTLAFDKDVRKELQETENLMSTLEKLLESRDKDVKKNAQGALWVLTGKGDAPTDKTKGPPRGKNHIFISYSWNEQEKVLEIRDKLRTEGYVVWVDVDEMGGSTLQAMAEAVENAAVVLVCMSEKYKQSPNCRTEAEYTFQLRKDYIPLMMQKKYRPDGWLGMILGAKLFFDFSGKYPFEKSMSGMLKELRGRGKRSNVLQSQSTDQVDALESTTENRLVFAGNPHRNTHPGTELAIPQGHQPVTHNMTRDDVQRWLITHQLDGSIAAFSQFDGRLLWQLREMKQEAPDYFYQCLEKKLSMNLIDMLRLASALDTLH